MKVDDFSNQSTIMQKISTFQRDLQPLFARENSSSY